MTNIIQKQEIPIFFATDDNYIPFLDISLRSLIENASNEFYYTINILNTGIRKENIEKIKKLEKDYVKINFCDISESIVEVKNKLRNIYHFGLATYYRLFIESLFPQYDKVIYLDCDIVVLGDISKMWQIDMGDNLVAGVTEYFVASTEEFRDYAQIALGIDPNKYINAGVIMMNLAQFRKHKIQDTFIDLINKYNFDTIDPDQAYLNFLCKDKILYLENGWNKTPLPIALQGPLNIVHYALYKKPWQYDDVVYGDYFWQYAKQSPFYNEILKIRANFDDEAKTKKEKGNVEIKLHAMRIVNSDTTFYKTLVANS